MFSDKVVIVTGASSGIGAAIAIMFCREGASVALVGRNETNLKKTSETCSKAGGKHLIIKADVSNDQDAQKIISDTINRFGKLDILVNNAGILAFGNILDGTILDVYDKIVPINLRGVINLTTLAAPHLIKTKGNIVNISSVAAQVLSVPSFTPYSLIKAALDYFTRGSAMELASSGVRVNAVSPGPVATEIFERGGSSMANALPGLVPPLGRVSQAEEVADLVQFLASDKAKAVTGSIYVADNGIQIRGAI